jgi:hypothetical protein
MKHELTQRTISPKRAIELAYRLAEEAKLSCSEVQLVEASLSALPLEANGEIRADKLVGVLDSLRKSVERKDASFLGQQRGYKTDKIVDVIEFVESREYYNIEDGLWQSEQEDLWKIWHEKPTPLEVVLTGAQGTAKSSTAHFSMSYLLYLLSLMHSPQAELNILRNDEIFIIIQSFKLETAEDAVYTRILRGVDASPYFQKHFPRNTKLSSELRFPNNIILKPITGSINAVQSKNVLGGVITEINEMKVHKNSVMLANTDKQVLDVGQEVFHNFRNRVIGRFKKIIESGDFINRIVIDSARRYLGDFTDRKTEEAKTDDTILVIERSLWSARPFDYEGESWFPVEMATDYRPARILTRIEDAEQWSDEFKKRKYQDIFHAAYSRLLNSDERAWMQGNLNVIMVPESHRKDLEKDIEDGLRDFAGVPATATGRFIPYPTEINKAIESFVARTSGASLFNSESVILKKDTPWAHIINYQYIEQLLVEGEFEWAVHVDTSLGQQDAAGLGVVRIVDKVVVEKPFLYDPSIQEVRRIDNVELPVYCVDGALQICAPPGEHINLLLLADLICELKEHINIVWGSADWMESESMLATWREKKIVSGKRSVDKTPDAYFELRHAIRDERILLPPHSILDTEIRHLQRVVTRGAVKITHPDAGSKDVADGVAGAIGVLKRARGRARVINPNEKNRDKRDPSPQIPGLPGIPIANNVRVAGGVSFGTGDVGGGGSLGGRRGIF